MYYSQEQIDRANQTNMEDFLRSQGETLIRSGKEYRWKCHDSLTVRGNKWFRHSQSRGGYPVDFVMEFYGKSFPEAVQMLTGEAGAGKPEACPAPSPDFRLPLHNPTNTKVIKYLTEERCLDRGIVDAFIAAGDIYEDTRHNVVFVGRESGTQDAPGIPRYAHCRGTADKFRQDVGGSDKACNFRYQGESDQLFVFEAPIDLLSFICLYPKDWTKRSYLSLGGVAGKALVHFLSERPDIRRIFLCLDNDNAGNEGCTRLSSELSEGLTVLRLLPAMKDWNEILQHREDIPNRKYIAETFTLKEPAAEQPVPMIRMSEVQEVAVEWLWEPYLPFGKLTILQGNPGEGKTYFAMQLAAACTNRRPLPNMEPLEPDRKSVV